MKRIELFFLLIAVPLFSVAQTDYTKYVDPFIGTGGHGHTYPGAVLPHGMVQLSPDTRNDGSWDGCSGYHYSDSAIFGFSHTHLSGTGCSDYGDILLLPVSGKVSKEDLVSPKFKAHFNHKNEKASPGFYAVKLEEGNINVELTATTRVGFHKYIFNNTGEDANVLVDLVHRDKVLDASLVIKNDHTIEGYRRSEGWAKNQTVMFVIEFSQPFTDAFSSGGSVMNLKEPVSGTNVRVCFRFKAVKDKPIYMKVALSSVSTEGAEKNMQAELPGWDFEKTKAEARLAWKRELGRIEVKGGTKDRMKIFYTSLYHCMVVPNVAMDVDGSYRGRDDKTHVAQGFAYYTVFSLWDTFRAWHPLMTIIDRRRTLDYIKTFLAQYEQGGLLPVWELSSNETECMIGYHSVSVIADAMVKGITGFDYEEAFAAMKKSAESHNRFGLGSYIDRGYISSEDDNESVSKTLEYAYDDWCIAQVANLLHHKEDYERYMERSHSWENLFDSETGFMRPKRNGGWIQPFDPREVSNNYTEANAWQYSFFVPQDAAGLIQHMGGNDKFEKKLDELFSTASLTTGRELSDITGMIGQYAHGNEPSHGIAYLYYYVNKPWKTQERLKQIMNDFYKPTPDGIIGNEDCGQMSAWYVMNAMGFYQDCPGNTRFVVCATTFPKVTINLESGKSFAIRNPNVNRVHYEPAFLDYNTIVKTDGLKIGKQPSKGEFEKKSRNKSGIEYLGVKALQNFLPVPVINSFGQSFRDSTLISISGANAKQLAYSIDDRQFNIYKSPFYIHESCSINAKAAYLLPGAGALDKEHNNISRGAVARFYKMPHPERTIRLLSRYHPQYPAGGEEAMIDGIEGTADWTKGNWQGYEGQDFECVIDLGAKKNVSKCTADFLQDVGEWIMMPKQVEFSFSDDGIIFSNTGASKNVLADTVRKVTVQPLSYSVESPRTARYVKVKASSYGKLPKWHEAAGRDSWMFLDEIFIE